MTRIDSTIPGPGGRDARILLRTLLAALLGCSMACQGYEYIRLEVTPPKAAPATVAPPPIAARAICVNPDAAPVTEESPVPESTPGSLGARRANAGPGGRSPDPATAELCAALEREGIFRAAPLFRGAAGARDAEVLCEVRTEVISDPVADTALRLAGTFFLVAPPYIGGFFNLIWTERDPPSESRVTLQVSILGGEPIASYEATGQAILYAQHPGSGRQDDGGAAAAGRGIVRAAAIESVASRFARDVDAHARIRAATEVDPRAAPELEPLLVSRETAASRARWRTRMLIQAKTRSLETILVERKTAELKDLIIALETNILDLAHESETAKDHAQRAVEKDTGGAEEARELSIALKERIEVLKPILAAVRDEAKNRDR